MQNGCRVEAVSVHDADVSSVAGIEHQTGNRFGNDSRTGTFVACQLGTLTRTACCPSKWAAVVPIHSALRSVR